MFGTPVPGALMLDTGLDYDHHAFVYCIITLLNQYIIIRHMALIWTTHINHTLTTDPVLTLKYFSSALD